MKKTKKQKIVSGLMLCSTVGLIVCSQRGALLQKRGFDYSSTSLESNNSESLNINSFQLSEMADKYRNVKLLEGDQLVSHNMKVDDVLNNVYLSDSQKEKLLIKLGVYNIDSVKNTTELAASSNNDVKLNRPTIKYDSKAKQYIITGRGQWLRHTYEVPKWSWWYPKVGSTKNIGGVDAIGISLSNTSGKTKGLALKSGQGKFDNGSAKKTVTTLSTSNDNYGGGYKVQDFIKFTKVDNYILWANTRYNYNAYYMQCTLRYNKAFSNYNGNAKLFYAHTWNSANISSIGVSKSGPSVSVSKTSNAWKGYSYSTVFKKGKQSK